MSSFTELSRVLREWPDSPVPDSQMKENCCERLRKALLQVRLQPERVGFGDIAGLVRHVLRHEDLSKGGVNQLRVPKGGCWPTREIWVDSGMRVVEDGGSLSMNAMPWQPDWLPLSNRHPPLAAAFREDKRRQTLEIPADPCIPEALGNGFSFYKSPGQQQAIRSVFCSRPQATLIINLPTGDGKSLVAWAPAILRGNQRGLTLVIVPTIALALDQELQYRRLGRVSHLTAYHGGLAEEDRKKIKQRIRDGTQQILFASPESVVGSLAHSLYEAAEKKYLRYFIVDEAHLVAQWGNEFRPEFQALSGIRKELLSACQFRTLLMTATLTQEGYNTLSVLFGPPEDIEVVSAVHLRPEPEYWISGPVDETLREERVLELVRHAPRPFLIYVSTQDQAGRWFSLLTDSGIRRLGCVHGNTPTDKRSSIIESWKQNDIDAVVATSAFGLGMDKADVRTVIHACVPETVDRYYQEVGRGGRDGKACVSLLIHTAEDREIARALNSERIISIDRGLVRWRAMLDDRRCENTGGGSLRVSLQAKPSDIRQDSPANKAWNLRTLTLMARSKLISIESEKPPVIEEKEGESEDQYRQRAKNILEEYYNSIVVRIHSQYHQDQGHWEELVEPIRRRTMLDDQANLENMNDVLKNSREMSEIFSSVYKLSIVGEDISVVPVCGGCGVCRDLDTSLREYTPPDSSPIRHSDKTVPEAFKTALDSIGISTSFVPVSYPAPGPGTRDVKKWRREIVFFLKLLVQRGGIKEISTTSEWLNLPEYRELYRYSSNQFILHSDIQERINLLPLQVPRVSLLDPADPPRPIPNNLIVMHRPLHILIAPENTPAQNPNRNFFDIAQHLTLRNFKREIDR